MLLYITISYSMNILYIKLFSLRYIKLCQLHHRMLYYDPHNTAYDDEELLIILADIPRK